MFDAPSQRYPRNWKEMSLDFKLMFVYHGCMMVLFIAGQGLSVRQEILFTASLAAILASISIRRRGAARWHWPGIRFRDVLFAILGATAVAFFLFSATPLFPPSNHSFLPWYLAGLGIGMFGILSSLKVVDASESDFQLHCRILDQYGRELEREVEPPEPTHQEARWKKTVRAMYTVAFLIVWIAGVASFFYFGSSFRKGSPVPTATQTEPLTDHGKTVYITRTEKERVVSLRLISWVGIPLVLTSAVVLHFVVGVKLFANVPTLSEYRARRSPSTVQPPPAKPL